jgi:hypothetical protein
VVDRNSTKPITVALPAWHANVVNFPLGDSNLTQMVRGGAFLVFSFVRVGGKEEELFIILSEEKLPQKSIKHKVVLPSVEEEDIFNERQSLLACFS